MCAQQLRTSRMRWCVFTHGTAKWKMFYESLSGQKTHKKTAKGPARDVSV